MGAAQGDDGVCTAHGPAHAGLFEPGANDGFATRLNHSGTNEQMLCAEAGIAHALGVSFKVVGFGTELFRRLDRA